MRTTGAGTAAQSSRDGGGAPAVPIPSGDGLRSAPRHGGRGRQGRDPRGRDRQPPPSRSSRRARGCGGIPTSTRTPPRPSAPLATRNGIATVTCHATYLINLGATDDAVYSKSVEALSKTMLAAQAYAADGVVFHLGSHLGRGLDAALHQVIPAMQVALGAGSKRSKTRLADRELGGRRQHHGPHDRRHRPRDRRARPAEAGRRLPRHLPPVGDGRRRARPGPGRRPRRARSTSGSGSSGWCACT